MAKILASSLLIAPILSMFKIEVSGSTHSSLSSRGLAVEDFSEEGFEFFIPLPFILVIERLTNHVSPSQ